MKYLIACFSIFLLVSCSNKEVEIQKRSFNLLKSLDTIAYDQFLNEYLHLEAYKTLALKKNIAQKYQDEILPITEYQWSYYRENEYENFHEQADSNEIVWKDIEFVDFIYEKNISFDLECLDATLFFKHNDTIYEARVYTIYDGNKYQIFNLKM